MWQKRGWWLIVGVLVVGGLSREVPAGDVEPSRHIGRMCWQMEPFVDRLTLNVAQTGLPYASLFQFFQFTARLDGADVYTLPGGGTAIYGGFDPLAFDLFSLEATLANTSEFFANTLVCALRASLQGLTPEGVMLAGDWTLLCNGNGLTLFLQQGMMVPIPCAVAQPPAHGIARQGRLAGE